MKAALAVFLFVPAIIHDQIEQAAKLWNDKDKVGGAHTDKCSCTCARLKALLNAVNDAMTGQTPLLTCPDPAKVMFTRLVEIVARGGAHTAVADITLRTASTRAPAQCPYII